MKLKITCLLLFTISIQPLFSSEMNTEDIADVIFLHISTGQIEVVKDAIDREILDINYQSKQYNYSTSLHLAVEYNKFNIVDYLLQKGADISLLNNSNLKAFDIAICEGFFEIADLFINKYNYNINTVDYLNRSSLLPLTYFNNVKGVEYLLKNGANPNLIITNQFTYLHEYFGLMYHNKKNINYEIVALYLEYGFDPTRLDPAGYNFAHTLGFYGDKKLIEMVSDYNIDFEKKDHIGDITPLMIAAGVGNIVYMEFLLEKGVNPNMKDTYGQSALFYALRNTDTFIEAYNLLLKYEADKTIIDHNGKTVFDYLPDEIKNKINI